MRLAAASLPSLPWLVIGLALAGCSPPPAGPSAEELLRRQQLQESSQLSRSRTFQERLSAAQDRLAEGNAVAAEKELRPLLISHPDHRQVLLLMAKIQAASGDRLAAAASLDSLDASDADTYVEALWLAAEWLVAEHRYDAAQQRLERMLEFPGDPTRVHRQLAAILNNQGRRIEAAVHLRALARSGQIREKELFAMIALSNPLVDESLPKPDFGKELNAAALAMARESRRRGDLQQASVLLGRLADAFPQSTPISAFQGRVFADLQDEVNLHRWVKSTPVGIEREPEYWHTLGIWMQRRDQHREAVRCLVETVARDETDRAAYSALARSLQFLGQHDAAQRAAERAAALTEVAGIAKKLGLQRGSHAQLTRMAELLEQLHRPWEALAWRRVDWKTFGGADDEWEAWRAQQAAVAQEGELTGDDFRTCGIDRSGWPLPDLATLGPTPAREATPSLAAAPIELPDVAESVGLVFQYDNGDDPGDDLRLIHQLTGGGIGVIDLDLDGWGDLYLTQGGGDAYDPSGSQPNRLFRNLQGAAYRDVSEASATADLGYGQGVAVADLNQDGFPDLVVANIGPNVLYRNNGDGTFARHHWPADDPEGNWTTSIACGDLSGDHLPEIVEVNYIDDPTALTTPCRPGSAACTPRVFQPAADQVWQVGRDGTLARWNGCREIADKPSFGFAVLMANFDGAAGNDLFIANDTRPNHYWISQADPQNQSYSLWEGAAIHGCAAGVGGQPRACMGVAHGDLDRNGRLDLHITNFWNEPSDVYLQRSTGLFEPANQRLGLYEASRETVGWGTQAVDLDRNGWLDLAVLNGHVSDERERGQPFQMRPQLFRGDADGFQLVEPARSIGAYWTVARLGRTMAVLDWNQDQRPDLVTNHLDAAVALLENHTAGGYSLQIELVGTRSERDAIGATVTLTSGDQSWTNWQAGGHGFLCSNDRRLDFGIGSVRKIDRLEVRWPSGLVQHFSSLEPNRRYLIVEGEDQAFGLDRVTGAAKE